MTLRDDVVATMAEYCRSMLAYLSVLASGVLERPIASLSALAPAPIRMEDSVSDVPPNFITEVLPDELLKGIIGMLPNSYRFVAPVSHLFRNLYLANDVKKIRKKLYRTDKFCISSEAALRIYLDEGEYRGSRESEISYIGAGCGRTDWVERGAYSMRVRMRPLRKMDRFDEWTYKDTCAAAAKGGQLRVLKWLRERNCPWDEDTCEGAARNGHFEILQWAREEGCPWDFNTCLGAAKGGHLEVLQWLREKRCPWNSLTCMGAAKGGNLEVLQWAREEGCPWDIWTCYAAARKGRLEILKWARANGCPWDSQTCTYAAVNNKLGVLRWAIENGCPYKEQDIQEHVVDPKFLEWFGSNRTTFPVIRKEKSRDY